jgi:murein L,D-transpeptidase YcbB/YkuD
MVLVDGPDGDRHGRTINWHAVSATQFPYQIRQLPGPGSAMGAIMLDAPNRFDVYLHDTPGKKPFENDDRTLSNGCIRVQDMMRLASLTLRGDDAMDEKELSQTIASRTTRRIPLDDHLPIYMAYWTAVADADGAVHFFPDRYNRDAPLISALGTGSREERGRGSSKDDSR